MKRFLLPVLTAWAAFTCRADVRAQPATGPLKVHQANPRYFTDGSGKAVYLAGSHTWGNLVDYTYANGKSPPTFDFKLYMDFLKSHNLNCFRLWPWESSINLDAAATTTFYDPMPYQRPGPGLAFDGKPKFDLSKFNQAYFDRVRARVEMARDNGMYVMVMLFQGFSVDGKGNILGNPILGHYLNPTNNIQRAGSDDPVRLRSPRNKPVMAYQEAYIRKVIDSVNDFDNVLYEIVNEDTGGRENDEWQYHVIRFIQAYEKTKPRQHPVGMTMQYPKNRLVSSVGSIAADDEVLFASPAAWISPNARYAGSDGRKVIVNDTDHSYFWRPMKKDGPASQATWVWINFTGGNNLLFMDPYLDPNHDPERNFPKGNKPDPYWDHLRDSIGRARAYAQRMDLAAMIPHGELVSSQHCLANPGREYLIYNPMDGEITVDLSAATGTFAVEWMNPDDGARVPGAPIEGGGRRTLKPPFAGDAVIYLRRSK